MKTIIHYPFMQYGYVEVEYDADADGPIDIGAEITKVVKEVSNFTPPGDGPAQQSSAKPAPSKPPVRSSGSQGTTKEESLARQNRAEIIELMKELAEIRGCDPKDVCREFTTYQGRGTTYNPHHIKDNRLYPILCSLKEAIEGEQNSGLPEMEDEPPF